MLKNTMKNSLRLLAVLILAWSSAPAQKVSASDCSLGDPYFFCACARYEAQQCASEYQACGGFFVEGCWEAYSQCRQDSGIDQCE
jgi:hypothetical protein